MDFLGDSDTSFLQQLLLLQLRVVLDQDWFGWVALQDSIVVVEHLSFYILLVQG